MAWLEVELPAYPKPVEFPGDQSVYELGQLTDSQAAPEQKVR